MHFLADQDVYRTTVEFLREMGHDVLTAREAGLHRATDRELLGTALDRKLVLLTRDKDFGALTFVSVRRTSGVILLRLDPSTTEAVHQELAKFLGLHKDIDMTGKFVVIEPGRHRIRSLGHS